MLFRSAYLTFREGSSADGELILDGSMIESAAAQYGPVSNGGASEYFVSLKFTDDGAKAFGDATTKLAASGGTISIWLDDENVSTATVNTAITDGSAIITSSASNPFTQEQVVKMARQINSGALPFALTVDSYSTVSPSLGENSLSAMVLAGLIAFALIVVMVEGCSFISIKPRSTSGLPPSLTHFWNRSAFTTTFLARSS